MTTAGDAAPGGSRSDWIVRLHKHTSNGTPEPSGPSSGPTVVLAGDVVSHRGDAGTDFGAVSIHRPSANAPVAPPSPTIDLRCELRDLPAARNAPPTGDLNHVIHVICSRFDDPEAIERFLDATRGLIDEYIIGREAWFEVLAHGTGADGNASVEPIVDDVYVGRYPTVEAWQALHEVEPWRVAIDRLESEAATMFHLVVAPTINRLAEHRGPGS